jgi:hypothetical protein
MPIGNEVGAFSLEVTSTTYSTGADGVSHVQLNMGGELEGDGQSDVVLGTLDIARGTDGGNGTYTWIGQRFSADDTGLSNGAGFVQPSGDNTWMLRGYNSFPDGTSTAVEGTLELASRSLKGSLLEWT